MVEECRLVVAPVLPSGGDGEQDNEEGKELRPTQHYEIVDTKQDIAYDLVIRIT